MFLHIWFFQKEFDAGKGSLCFSTHTEKKVPVMETSYFVWRWVLPRLVMI